MSRPPVAAPGSHADAVRDFRRTRMLAAARAVFSEKGLEGASLRAIAHAAGCTTGAIYSQFRGKEELYAEVLSESLANLLAHVSASRSGAAGGTRGLRRAIDAFFGYYLERPTELALGLYLFQGVRAVGLGRELDARLNGQLRAVLDVLRDAMLDVAPHADAELETAALFTFLIGSLIVEQTQRVRVTQHETSDLLDHYVAALLARLAPRRAPRR